MELRHYHTAKLTYDQVYAVLELLASGCPQKEIAKLFGVCPATINFIKFGRTYTHVTQKTH